MEIIINTDLIKELNLNINEYLTLYKLYSISNKLDIVPFKPIQDNLDSLVDKGFVTRSSDGITLTEQSNLIFAKKIDKLEELVDRLKEIYPKGKKNGQYYWFGNKPEVKTKLKKFLKTYKTVTYDQIELAVTNYVNSFTDYNRNSGMMLLKYFIIKEDTSTLYTEIENLNNSDEEIVESYIKEL